MQLYRFLIWLSKFASQLRHKVVSQLLTQWKEAFSWPWNGTEILAKNGVLFLTNGVGDHEDEKESSFE